MRLLLYPFIVLYRWLLLKAYSHSIDSRYIQGLRNKHAGKRCFIIGNGPSLRPDDLDKIKDEYSIATNRIYHIFDRTEWRPTYYLCIDSNIAATEIKNIKRIGSYPKFINYKASRYGRKESENIWYICLKGKFHVNAVTVQVDTLSDDVSKYMSWVHTVSVGAVEMAIYMGFKEIYFLGTDNTYKRKIDKNGKIEIDPNVQANHFAGAAGEKLEQARLPQPRDAVNECYELAKRFAEERGVKIYNATRGGELEVFERVNFDALFADGQ